MTGEIINTGVTFGVGRNAINNAFSGTAEFNNIVLDSGANFSGGSGGGIIYSAGTDLYGIFLSAGDGNDITRIKGGTNIVTGGTGQLPIISTVASPSFNGLTLSGTGQFASITATSAYALTLSGGTIYSGSTNLGDIISSLSGGSGSSGNLWSASTAIGSIIQNNNTLNSSNSQNGVVIGSGNTIYGGMIGGPTQNSYCNIFGGINNAFIQHFGGTFSSNACSSIISGKNNIIQGFNATATNCVLIGGEKNSLKGLNNSLVGGSGNTFSFEVNNSVILGGQNLDINKDNTAIMQRAHINEFLDFMPQTSLPTPEIGRVFFSGGTLNRLMINSGGTINDWMLL